MKRRELQAILSLDNRGDNCVPSTWGCQTKRESHIRRATGGLQATYTRPYKGTPFTSAVRFLLCSWRLSMHFIIVPPGEKHIQRRLRFETDAESLSFDSFGQNKSLPVVTRNAAVTLTSLFVNDCVGHEGRRSRFAGRTLKFVYCCNLTACQYTHVCLIRLLGSSQASSRVSVNNNTLSHPLVLWHPPHLTSTMRNFPSARKHWNEWKFTFALKHGSSGQRQQRRELLEAKVRLVLSRNEVIILCS